jgi:hypothetical protein
MDHDEARPTPTAACGDPARRRPAAPGIRAAVVGAVAVVLAGAAAGPPAIAAPTPDRAPSTTAGAPEPSTPPTTTAPATPPGSTTTVPRPGHGSSPSSSTPSTTTPEATDAAPDQGTSPATPPPTAAPADPTPATTGPPDAPGPAAPAALGLAVYPDQVGQILATIRYMESRGIYTSPPNAAGASGAYQYIPSTWANHGGYPHAYLAPPAVQDERAAQDVVRFLAEWNDDVSMIPVLWYFPAAARDPALMDRVPRPSLGNVLTIREYQQRWLGVFATFSGVAAPGLQFAPLDLDGVPYTPPVDGAPPLVPPREDGLPALSFPVLGPGRVAVPDCDDAEVVDGAPSRVDIEAAGLCRDEAPGIVFGVQLQPVLAVVDGVVTSVIDEPGTDRPISVTVTDTVGRSYVYAGFNDDRPGTSDGAAPDHLRLSALARVGATVRAGQVLGFMGDTDPLPVGVRADVPTDPSVTLDPEAVAPHIRLTIFDLDGTAVDTYGPVIDALLRQSCTVVLGPWSATPRDTPAEPVDVDAGSGGSGTPSRWTITSTGEVVASGWAAMVGPDDSCPATPTEPYGPGAAGSTDVPGHWATPIDLPTGIWVDLALQESGTAGELVNDF